jgi:ankyrin repeat protein
MLLHHYPQTEHVNWADSRGWTALIEACSNGYLQIVNFLLEKGARADHTDETKRSALHIAALRGHVEVCGCLLAVQPSLLDATDYFSATALLLALDQQRLPVVELLMMRKPTLNKADKEGYTLAHVGALTGAIQILRTLAVAEHELLDTADHRGRTPLIRAAQRGQMEVGVNSSAKQQLNCSV